MVRRIEVRVITSRRDGAGTDGDVYLGLGGREFYLDTVRHDDFQLGDDITYMLGEESNLAHPMRNDPREHYALRFLELGLYPAYLRFSPAPLGDDWDLAGVDVTVLSGEGERRFYTAVEPGQHIWLSRKSGQYIYLKAVDALPDRTYQLGG